MQDDNLTQPTVSSDQAADTTTDDGPKLSLGTNPSTAQSTPASDAPADPPTPIANDSGSEQPVDIEPVADTDNPPADISAGAADEVPSPSASSSTGDGGLESIKSSALNELMPLVSELDQEPEDKYRTLMMLIQSSDNKELVKDAFEAASKIEDKKAKAEAMLHIINEINYLTGNTESSDEK